MEKMEQLKAEFHKELYNLRYDLGGSLADMVEAASVDDGK